ncbi:MAG: sporulation integral membrane protein YtvI [Eubacterium sp.]|nr:sporulation integral membrane protein YtvI [Eubacterium sp.]
MNEKVEKRRAAIINIAFFAIIAALIYVFFKYCFFVAAPFLISFFFAVILQKPLRWLDKKTNKKLHTLWSVLLVVLSIIIILGPVIILLTLAARQIASFISYLVAQLNDMPAFLSTLEREVLDIIDFLPDSLYNTASSHVTEFFGNMIDNFDLSTLGIDVKTITNGVSSSITSVYNIVKNVPSALIAIVIGIVAWIFFTKDYNRIVGFIRLQLPDGKKNLLSEVKQIFSKTVLKMFRAYGLIMIITFCELMIGFSILRVTGILDNNYIAMIAVAIAIFDILPVAGSGGILIPWSLINLILGNFALAGGLMLIYIAITVIRQYLEPKIVGDTLGVHPIVTLAGLYFGLKLFGFMGMFIVPITVMTIKAFNDAGRIHLYKPPKRN